MCINCGTVTNILNVQNLSIWYYVEHTNMFGYSVFFCCLRDFLCTYSSSSQTWPLSLINPILVLLNSLFLFSPLPHEYCPRKAKDVNAKTATLRHCPEHVFDPHSCRFRDYMRTDRFLGLWLWCSGYVFGFSQVALNLLKLGKNFLLSSFNVQFFCILILLRQFLFYLSGHVNRPDTATLTQPIPFNAANGAVTFK